MTNLADTMQNLNNLFQEPDMERRQCQLDITKMTVTVLQLPMTRLTLGRLIRSSHTHVQRSVLRNHTPTFRGHLIVGMTIRDFDDRLTDNILARPAVSEN